VLRLDGSRYELRDFGATKKEVRIAIIPLPKTRSFYHVIGLFSKGAAEPRISWAACQNRPPVFIFRLFNSIRIRLKLRFLEDPPLAETGGRRGCLWLLKSSQRLHKIKSRGWGSKTTRIASQFQKSPYFRADCRI
jgi:hypothetical protein